MSDDEILRRLDDLTGRLTEVADRLARIERAMAREQELRERLDYEIDARRRLGEQTQWLIESLGETTKNLRWFEAEYRKAKGDPPGG